MNRRHFAKGAVGGAIASLTIIQFGDSVTADSTRLQTLPRPHEPAPATPEVVADMEIVDADVRDILARPWKFEGQFTRFHGTVEEMRVAPPGSGFPTGTEIEGFALFRTQIIMDAEFEDGNTEEVLIVCDFDPDDVHQDLFIEVVTMYKGAHIEEARGGGYWEWPIFVAVSVEPQDRPTEG